VSNRRRVVLDKSFLIGAGKAVFVSLNDRYDFLAIDALLGECFQTFLPSQQRDEEIRKRNVCALLKFAEETSRLFRVKDTAYLVGTEARTRRPCWPIEDYIGSRIQFNPDYFDNERWLRDEETPTVERWSAWVAGNVQASLDCYSKGSLWPIRRWDAELASLFEKDGEPSMEAKSFVLEKLPEFRKRVAEDEDFVRAQYAWMRPLGYPAPDKISPHWLLYRSIQIQLLVHLNLIERNQANPIQMSLNNITHEWLDFHYCLLATQFGALATGETSQMERFRLLCPNGLTLFYSSKAGSVTEVCPDP
jgi:hypothetical protein